MQGANFTLNSERNLRTKPAFQALPLRLSVHCVRLELHRSGQDMSSHVSRVGI